MNHKNPATAPNTTRLADSNSQVTGSTVLLLLADTRQIDGSILTLMVATTIETLALTGFLSVDCQVSTGLAAAV